MALMAIKKRDGSRERDRLSLLKSRQDRNNLDGVISGNTTSGRLPSAIQLMQIY